MTIPEVVLRGSGSLSSSSSDAAPAVSSAGSAGDSSDDALPITTAEDLAPAMGRGVTAYMGFLRPDVQQQVGMASPAPIAQGGFPPLDLTHEGTVGVQALLGGLQTAYDTELEELNRMFEFTRSSMSCGMCSNAMQNTLDMSPQKREHSRRCPTFVLVW